MDSLKNIDLGSTLLTIVLVAGFVAFTLIILRLILFAINFTIDNMRVNLKQKEQKTIEESKKGF